MLQLSICFRTRIVVSVSPNELRGLVDIDSSPPHDGPGRVGIINPELFIRSDDLLGNLILSRFWGRHVLVEVSDLFPVLDGQLFVIPGLPCLCQCTTSRILCSQRRWGRRPAPRTRTLLLLTRTYLLLSSPPRPFLVSPSPSKSTAARN